MSQGKEEKERRAFMVWAGEMYEELREWRRQHPAASFDEIAAQVTPRRRSLMGKLLGQLASQHGAGEVVEGVKCPDCGQAMSYKGKAKRGVEHLEGETKLARAYYYCAQCEAGLFPPG